VLLNSDVVVTMPGCSDAWLCVRMTHGNRVREREREREMSCRCTHDAAERTTRWTITLYCTGHLYTLLHASPSQLVAFVMRPSQQAAIRVLPVRPSVHLSVSHILAANSRTKGAGCNQIRRERSAGQK